MGQAVENVCSSLIKVLGPRNVSPANDKPSAAHLARVRQLEKQIWCSKNPSSCGDCNRKVYSRIEASRKFTWWLEDTRAIEQDPEHYADGFVFCTASGFVGMTPNEVLEDDIVGMVDNTYFPAVFRPRSRATHGPLPIPEFRWYGRHRFYQQHFYQQGYYQHRFSQHRFYQDESSLSPRAEPHQFCGYCFIPNMKEVAKGDFEKKLFEVRYPDASLFSDYSTSHQSSVPL